MALTELTTDLGYIAALDDEPNDVTGLTPALAKAEFDKGAKAIQTYINDSLIPEIDAVHIPLDSTVSGGQTIKEAVDGIVLGAIPDDSLTLAKIDSDNIATEAQALAGTSSTTLMTAQRVAQAIHYREFPFEELTATYSESVSAAGTVTKSIAHSLGVAPSKLKVWFKLGDKTACVDVLYNGTTYYYSMSGIVCNTGGAEPLGGSWKASAITGNYLFGIITTDIVAGSHALGDDEFRLSPITATDAAISIPILNSSAGAKTLSTVVTVEVYA